MTWEALTALSTAFTGIVIAVTAIAAVREVRVATEHANASREQLEQLRKATQFEGALAAFRELDDPRQMEARNFVMFELAVKMRDEQFRKEVAMLGAVDERKHPELVVLRCFERLAYYVNHGFVEREVFMTAASGRVLGMWTILQEVVEIHTQVVGGPFWTNFRTLFEATKQWYAERGLDVLGPLQRGSENYRKLREG